MNTKRLLVILVLVIFLYLIFTVLKRASGPTPKTPPVPSPPTVESLPSLPREPYQASPSGVIFTVVLPSLLVPPTLPVYSLAAPEPALEQVAQQLASRLGLPPSPTRLTTVNGELLTWSSPTTTVVVDEADGSLSYHSRQPSEETSTPAINQADAAVRQFLTENGLATLVPHLVTEDSRLVDPKKLPPSQENGETRVSLSYRVMIEGRFPLYTKTSPTPTVLAVVGSGGEISSLLVSFSGLPGQKLRDTVPLPPDQIAKALNQTLGTLVSYTARKEAQKEFNEPPSFTRVALTTGKVVYLIFETEKLVRPVYLLDGTATDPSGESFSVRYMLAAAN